MYRRLLLLAIFLAAACVERAREQAAPPPAASPSSASLAAASGSCAARLVTGDAVGPLRIGVSIDSVRRMCRVVHDTTVKAYATAAPVRQLSVLLGADTAVVSVASGRVSEILVSGRTFATADSLGVGTTLKRLLGYAQPKGYGVGGQLIVSTATHCGLSFYFAGRFDGLPEGFKDSTVLRRFPPEAVVDRVRIDGCEDDDGQLAEDDSTYDVVTDSVLLAGDLDGNGVKDVVALENRPFRRSRTIGISRITVYLDSVNARHTPTWATEWDMDIAPTLVRTERLERGTLLVIGGNGGDYSSETLIVARDGKVTEELTHGEDYADGYFRMRREGSTLVVDASQKNLLLRGKPVPPELECPRGESAGVLMRWDETSGRFVPDAPRCVNP